MSELTYFDRKCSAFMNFCAYYSHVLILSGISRFLYELNNYGQPNVRNVTKNATIIKALLEQITNEFETSRFANKLK